MTPARFNADAVHRIRKLVKAEERRPRGTADRWHSKTPFLRPGILAVLTTDVTARSGTSPNFTLGSGTATLLWCEAGVTSDSGISITVYNSTTQVLYAATSGLLQLKLIDGCLVIDVADCSSASPGGGTTGGGTTGGT